MVRERERFNPENAVEQLRNAYHRRLEQLREHAPGTESMRALAREALKMLRSVEKRYGHEETDADEETRRLLEEGPTV